MIFRTVLVGCIALYLPGCAYTSVIPIDPRDMTTQGQRVYDSKPILIVTGTSAQIQFIPNYSRAYAVQFGAFLSRNEYSITVDNGVIKTLDSKLDSTAIVELLKTIADKALSAGLGQTTGGEPVNGGGVAIFDFVFDDVGNIIELRPIKVEIPASLRRMQLQAVTSPAPNPTINNKEKETLPSDPKKQTPRV